MLNVETDGVEPDEEALAHEEQAIIGEASIQMAILVGKQGIELN